VPGTIEGFHPQIRQAEGQSKGIEDIEIAKS
jgi:hypothetical protein